MKSGLVSRLKSAIVPRGSCPRRIPLGLYKSIVLDIDLANSTQLYLGLWERETYEYIRCAASRCEWAMDIGAGKGELSIYLAKFSSAKRIWAFEPNGVERERFVRNAGRNPGASIQVELCEDFIGMGSGQTALDSLPVDAGSAGFIRIDVDGAEFEVLASGRQLLATSRLDLVVETHSADLEARCLDLLKRQNFNVKLIRNAWFRSVIPEQRPIGHNRWIWASNHHTAVP